MTAAPNLRFKRGLCLSLSLILGLILIIAILFFLLQQRSYHAVLELHNNNQNRSAISNLEYQLRKVRYVEHWLTIKNIFWSNSDTHWIKISTDVYSQLLRHQDIKAPDLASQCDSCPEQIYRSLKKAQEKITELQKLSEKTEYLIQQISKLRNQKIQRIRLHQLLAKDFEMLVGSPSLYTKNSTEILYFTSGPFKWLPQLDTAKVDRSIQSQVVPNFSEKLDSLRTQSKKIVDEFTVLATEETQALKEQSELQVTIDLLSIEVKYELLNAWTTYLPFFDK